MESKGENFLQKLFDWKDFEHFVTDIYKHSDEVEVRHNVTEVGKSGAKRQIDVLVTQKSKLHSTKTVIECKHWKDKVDRPVIDVVAAAVRDLNANKGVVFTTSGFEPGAESYAKSENIDIFVIRDIKDDEWGKPGKIIWFYTQYFNSLIGDFSFEGVKLAPGQTPPTNKSIKLDVRIGKDQEYPPHLQMYDLSKIKGPHFTQLVILVRNDLLSKWMESANCVLEPESGNPQVAVEFKVTLDFTNYPHRYFLHEESLIGFEKMSFKYQQSVTQNKTVFDRTKDKDFALIVENYITNQRNYVSKEKGSETVDLSEPIEDIKQDEGQIMENGSIMKVMFEPYVLMTLKPDTKINKINDFTLEIKAPEKVA